MDITEKYNRHRTEIKNGDIILFRGKNFVSRAIQSLDNSYYSHIGLIFESNNRLLIVDSNANGVRPDFLSYRIENHIDFCIIRPSAKIWDNITISKAVEQILIKAEEKIKYDKKLIIEITIFRKFGIEIHLDDKDKDICSEFVRRYTRLLDPKPNCFEQPTLPDDFITPWDYMIYYDRTQFEILFDDSDHSKFRKK